MQLSKPAAAEVAGFENGVTTAARRKRWPGARPTRHRARRPARCTARTKCGRDSAGPGEGGGRGGASCSSGAADVPVGARRLPPEPCAVRQPRTAARSSARTRQAVTRILCRAPPRHSGFPLLASPPAATFPARLTAASARTLLQRDMVGLRWRCARRSLAFHPERRAGRRSHAGGCEMGPVGGGGMHRSRRKPDTARRRL